jgi:hypothetical protein
MTDKSNRRGRPKGTEKDDGAALVAVADLLILNPGMKPTTAMRQLNPNIGEAELRRLQAKWKQRQKNLLAEAKSRIELRTDTKGSWSHEESGFVTGMKRANVAYPHIGKLAGAWAIQDLDNLSMMSHIQEMYNSPILRAARELANPLAQTTLQLQRDPIQKLIREQQRLLDAINGRF